MAIYHSDQWPEIYAFGTELNKNEPWRSHITAYELVEIFDIYYQLQNSTSDKQFEGLIFETLGDEGFRKYADTVKTYLLSLPRCYELWVELPSMPCWGGGEIELSSRINLVEMPRRKKPFLNSRRSLADLMTHPQGSEFAVYLKVLCEGYGAPRLNATAVRHGMSHAKQFLQLFRQSQIFKQAYGLLSGAGTSHCFIRDSKLEKESVELELPSSINDVLYKLSLDETKLTVSDPHGKVMLSRKIAETKTEKIEALQLELSDIRKILDCTIDGLDATRIRTALEWSFDSQQNENQTLAFIQACIGLEALLGDDEQDEPLTTRLADRCAYLLGQGHQDRGRIRTMFKEIYKVRSKLVHGRTPTLNFHDAKQLDFAQSFLDAVIRKERISLVRTLNKQTDQSRWYLISSIHNRAVSK